MKNLKLYIGLILTMTVFSFFSCGEEPISGTVIPDPKPMTELDLWIDTVFRQTYNIRVQYKWDEADTDHGKPIVPPKEELVQPFLKAVMKIWGQSYVDVAQDSVEFLREYSFRELKLIGSGSWNNESVTLGLAEGGYKITLYTVNDFDLEKGVSRAALQEFFQTMHHEFGHILNQRKKYDPQFKNISGGYVASWTSFTDEDALKKGFVSAYSMSGEGEDFVEILAHYVCRTEDEWEALLSPLSVPANDPNFTAYAECRRMIDEKLQVVSSYMQDSYGVDVDELRDAILKNIDEVVNGNLD